MAAVGIRGSPLASPGGDIGGVDCVAAVGILDSPPASRGAGVGTVAAGIRRSSCLDSAKWPAWSLLWGSGYERTFRSETIFVAGTTDLP